MNGPAMMGEAQPFDSDAAPLSASLRAKTPHASSVSALGDSTLLPRLAPEAARALRRAYAWPRPFALEAGGTGYALRWDFNTRLAQGAPRCYRFRLGPASGWLLLEPLAERELIGDAADPAVPDAIRCALVADALAPVCDALARLTRHDAVLLAPEHGEAPSETNGIAELRFSVSKVSPVSKDGGADWRTHGALQFDDARFLALACPADPPLPSLGAQDFDMLTVPLSFCIGSTRLTQQELDGLWQGDIIAIERWKSAGTGLTCHARTRGSPGITLNARVLGATITIEQIQGNAVTSPTPTPDQYAAPAADDTNAGALPLDSLEVTTSFELERLTLTLAQLKALRPGFVLELDQPLNQGVIRILANGTLVGHGHLIAVGNKLGVRVAELAPGTAQTPPHAHTTDERHDG
ncbi:type III secretion system cytoplasmic ring protein SctQ [Paraburkholderia sp. IMGN_8]|uniref:type III secretion system cytoplasmic ring protein SctQ n=1 Tax=Paraburkholderia sp. IMGN_8 TaxID=3136564 RepID=UPI003100D14E